MGGDGGSNKEAPLGVTGETEGKPALTGDPPGETEERIGDVLGGGSFGSGGGGEANCAGPCKTFSRNENRQLNFQFCSF